MHECGLCGARFGDRAAVEALQDADDAARVGIEPGIWPLIAVLDKLPGLRVRGSRAGDRPARTLPFVELGVLALGGLAQLENLAKSLQVSRGSLRLHWVVEVEYQHHLVFVLKPRHAGGNVPVAMVDAAAHDVVALRQQLERDMHLSWWRHAAPPPSG